MSDASDDHQAILAEADVIYREVARVMHGKHTTALYLALGEVLGAVELASRAPNRAATFRVLGAGMDEYIVANAADPAAARKLIGESKVEQAAAIDTGACDFCPAIHVNLYDAQGECFATGSVPIANAEAFIKRFGEAMGLIAKRHRAPGMRQ